MSLKQRLFTKTEKHKCITSSTFAHTPKFSEFGQNSQKNDGAGPVLALSAAMTKFWKIEEKLPL